MSPRSPHVNMRVPRATHDQLTHLAIELAPVVGRRLSLTDILTAVTSVGSDHLSECVELLKGT
ncbi:MAG: hypothetical protein ACRDTZ_00020 [Pseudonocardiaceae bacterium]